VETLRPTYRLLIGVPGKSNAFAISEKLGLPDYVIEEAKEHLTKQDEDFEDVISDLESSRATIEREQQEINRYKQEIETLKTSLERKEDRLSSSRDAILQKAREEAQAILREAKEYADDTIRKYNKLGKESDASKQMEQERARLREKMSANEKNMGLKAAKKPSKELTAKDLRIGDSVRVLSMNLKGTVSTKPDTKGNLYVQMGILRSQVNLKDLEKLEEETPYAPQTKTRSGGSQVKLAKSYSVSAEINLIGMSSDEAIVELDKYLDDAYLAHISPVRVVHGKGSGILRKAVHQYLRRQKHVASYRLGEYGEGDAGVTIVEFK
jgi:DNA mismatch repair protein MutS2